MKTINIKLESTRYPVYIGRGCLHDRSLWNHHLGQGKVLVVSNDTVAPLYLNKLLEALGGRDAEIHILPDGEQHKTLETWSGILDKLVGIQARRDSTLIALGGGVVGDITGYAAASYMRGVRFIQAPTTLLSQVDASVGGKTGVNHPSGKNLVGAFHQPHAVMIDSATLDSLPAREFNAGMAEVVKYGALCDRDFYDWLQDNSSSITRRDEHAIDYLIERCVLDKAEIVGQDEKESGIRALLNLGHSFGHALESETAYARYLHGEAVAIGMVTAAILSEKRGLCERGSAKNLSSLLKKFDLPVLIPDDMRVERLADALKLDKKAVASGLRLVLLRSIGEAVVDQDSTAEQILEAIKESQG